MKSNRVRIALALAASAVLLAGCDKSASASDPQLAGCPQGHPHAGAAPADLAGSAPPMAQVLTVEDTTYESETGALVRVVTRRTQIVRLLPVEAAEEEVQQPRAPQAGSNLRLTAFTAERKQIP